MPTPNPYFFIQQPLQQVIHNKDDGSLLAAGVVSYFSDPEFTIPKNVYEVSNDPDGNYIFTNIGSVLTLSSIGSFVDADGNNLLPMLFPWTGTPEDPGTFEPYYITVYSAGGVLQFTVTGFPYNNFSQAIVNEQGTETSNQITNPQFSEVLFAPTPPTTSYIYNVSGTGTVTAIAPNWYIKTSGSGTVTVSQITLETQTDSNAPYALAITSASITSLGLFQRITQSPRLLEGKTVAAYFEAKSTNGVNQPLTLYYVSYNGSTGASQEICTGETGTTQSFVNISGAKTINTAVNVDNVLNYVDILLDIPIGAQLQVTSFQFLGVPDENTVPGFAEISTPLQKSLLFSYWQDALNYKPIPSYLIGWDFPFNPAQPLGSTVAAFATGINTSNYVWDQTIAFQTADNSVSFSRDANTKGFKISAVTNTTSFAIIQYLPAEQAREILSQRNAVALRAFLSGGSGTLVGTIGLYWTADATLPNIKSPDYKSLVTGITSGTLGAPPTTATANGTWTQVPNKNLGNSAPFTLTTTSQEFTFAGFDASATAGKTTATFFAVVISFNTMPITNTVTIDYCSLVGGDIATRPAPKSYGETLIDCQYFFQSSFNPGVVPGANLGLTSGVTYGLASTAGAGSSGPFIAFNTPMIHIPVPGLYNPQVAANNNIRNISVPLTMVNSAATDISQVGFRTTGDNTGGAGGNIVAVAWVADARLGTY